MSSLAAASFLSSLHRFASRLRPLIALPLLIIGSLLWSPVTAVVTPPPPKK